MSLLLICLADLKNEVEYFRYSLVAELSNIIYHDAPLGGEGLPEVSDCLWIFGFMLLFFLELPCPRLFVGSDT